jgi:hypothetical protein
MPSNFDDARYWNTRAETMRLLADELGDPFAKQTLLKAADEYHRLAQEAEQRIEAERRNLGLRSSLIRLARSRHH